MKTIPILFSTPMVQAILEGLKTQTRRVIKKQPDLSKHTHITRAVVLDGTNTEVFNYCSGGSINVESVKCPYGQPGDILWVRETWQQEAEFFEASAHSASWDFDWWESTGQYVYRADGTELPTESEAFGKWKPSIHMSKEACRLFLKVKSVRVERLKEISRHDAAAEGVCIENEAQRFPGYQTHRWPEENFQTLWCNINGERSWNENPWVWVVEFEKVAKPDNF